MKTEIGPSDLKSTRPAPFEFGKNWSGFLKTLDDRRIADARLSMQKLLHVTNLQNRRFLDAGSGSGLFSLAAVRLGADVTSFDVDVDSVECTRRLKELFSDNQTNWQVVQGSLIDSEFLKTLGDFDVIYCWGVAHHTGNMWKSIESLLPLVRGGGIIVLAIYNDQLYVSRIWLGVKRIYQLLPAFIRPFYVACVWLTTFMKRLGVTLLACCVRFLMLKNPLTPIVNWIREHQARGMHSWHDLVDWVGGWPFEVAKPETVFRFLRDRGFVLQELTTSSGHGCNEFVFMRSNVSSS